MPKIERVMLATDFSPRAQVALHYAAELSARLGAPLLVATAYVPPAAMLPEGAIIPSASTVADGLGRAARGLEETARTARELGAVSVETVLAQGPPELELVELARDRAIDLIVMGTHGRRGLGRALLGSVADEVVRRAPCPVLVAHSTDQS